MPPARSLRRRRSSHFSAFSLSDQICLGDSISLNVKGDLEEDEAADTGDGDCMKDIEGFRPDPLTSSVRVGVRGVAGTFGEATDAVPGEISSGGTCLRELLRGRGGASVAGLGLIGEAALPSPNSDIVNDMVDLFLKLLTELDVLKVGIVGEEWSVLDSLPPPAVAARLGGRGSDGRGSSVSSAGAEREREGLRDLLCCNGDCDCGEVGSASLFSLYSSLGGSMC